VLTFEAYQTLANRTENITILPGTEIIRARLIHALLGLASETGEFAGSLKKTLIYDAPLDTENLAEEIGDILWYMAVVANALNIHLSDVAEANIQKLRKRYPEKYTDELAIRRLDKSEGE